MEERLVMMPCRCRIYLDFNLALKEVTVVDHNTELVVFKVTCWYCHKVKRYKMGWVRFYELFSPHLEIKNDGNKL